MWHSIASFFVSIAAAVTAPFSGTPPQPVPQPIIEQVSVAAEAIPEQASEPQTVATEEVPENVPEPPEPAPDLYCVKYEDKYSKEEYRKRSQVPNDVKKECKEKNQKRKEKAEEGNKNCDSENGRCSSVMKALQADCDKVYDDKKEEFKDWEEGYVQYLDRCSQ
ncbi:MAG: hypothetical protein WDN67_00585 [Candidatus Moraniibacteriota bacterium]